MKALSQAQLESLATDILRDGQSFTTEHEWTDIEADYLTKAVSVASQERETQPQPVAPHGSTDTELAHFFATRVKPQQQHTRQTNKDGFLVYKGEEVEVRTKFTKKLTECKDFTPPSYKAPDTHSHLDFKWQEQVNTNTVEDKDYNSNNLTTATPLEWDGKYTPPLDNSYQAQSFQTEPFTVAPFKDTERLGFGSELTDSNGQPRLRPTKTHIETAVTASHSFGAVSSNEYGYFLREAQKGSEWLEFCQARRQKEAKRASNTARDTKRRHDKLQRLANKGKLPKHLEAELKSYTL